MKIVVVSMIREPWGGSEELWAAMAKVALEKGHEIHLSAIDCGEIAPKLKDLIKINLHVHFRRGFIKRGIPFLNRIFLKGWYFILDRISNPFKRILEIKPDVIIYNGTCYSIAEDRLLLNIVKRSNALFFIIGHFN